MYSVSDIADLGAAHELVLSDHKDVFVFDDNDQQTMSALESFDE